MTHPDDDRSPLARAMEWASRVISIALEMVIPGLIGLWIDRKLGTVMAFLLLGVILGVTTGMIHLVRLAASAEGNGRSSDRRPPGEGKSPANGAAPHGDTGQADTQSPSEKSPPSP